MKNKGKTFAKENLFAFFLRAAGALSTVRFLSAPWAKESIRIFFDFFLQHNRTVSLRFI